MADVDGFGQLVMRGGGIVPLSNTALSEGGFEEIQTDANFVGSAQNAGTFATQSLKNPVVMRAGITATTDMCAAYIRCRKNKSGSPRFRFSVWRHARASPLSRSLSER